MTEELLGKNAAKVKAIRRHYICLEIEESEENSGRGTLEETEDEEVECSSSESGDEGSDQEVDNKALENIVVAEISDKWERPTLQDPAELSLGDQK